jgi:hypothetical protein
VKFMFQLDPPCNHIKRNIRALPFLETVYKSKSIYTVDIKTIEVSPHVRVYEYISEV